jgi:predicted heme/steroid binding protein
MRGTWRGAAICILTAISAFATACGGGGGTTGGGGGNQNPTTPNIAVSPASSSITTVQSLNVTVAVSGSSGTPTGTVVLSGGTYASSATALSSGSASITIPANTFTIGSVTLKASYTPDSASSALYNPATGQSSAINVSQAQVITVSVDQSGTSIPVTDQLLGMNLAAWYDVAANATGINTAFSQAGIKAIRWPGGSWSDAYHWGQGGVTPFMCTGTGSATGWAGSDTFSQFVSSIAHAGGYDLALTANYGSNTTCTAGGDPAEAAAWVADAVNEGTPPSHVTVGNEEYGSWEYDLHAIQHDPATYAGTVTGANGFYNLIKAANSTTKVGVVVDADNTSTGWDKTVLDNAKGSYDFVEFHFYPQAPGSESDTYLVHQAAQDLTSNLNTLKTELTAAGVANTPIYVGEMGSVYSDPGKQSWSITQGLYAGQTLGEMMNSGVARATWWIGFGNCNSNGSTAEGNLSSSLYGWQTFGAYNVFSDGPSDGPCGIGSGALGAMSPTARAFQLFSNVAVTGESVLSASVSGTSDIRAYAATHSGGSALVLFNLNETTSEPVTVTLSNQNASAGVTVITYDKAIYDQTNSATQVWAPPTTNNMGAQGLPLTLTLTPWSMNVVIIK